MNEQQELNDLERQELEAYRKYSDEILKQQNSNNKGANKNKLADKIAYFLGVFVSCGIITFILQFAWNYSLVKILPQLPQITMFQMAGLWFICHILLGSRNK